MGYDLSTASQAKIKLNGIIRNIVSMWYNNVMVWPRQYSYEVTLPVVHYSSGTKINAAGSNYAWVTGTVLKKINGQTVQTLTDQILTPVAPTSNFYLNENYIYGYDLLNNSKDETTDEISFCFTDETVTSEAVQCEITQEANERLVHQVTNRTIQLTAAGIGCTETSFSILPEITSYYYDEYTSLWSGASQDNEGIVTIMIDGVSAGTTSHNVALSYHVQHNKYHTSSRSWSCYGSIDTYISQTITLNQGADEKIWGNWENLPYEIVVSKIDDYVSAAGGTDRYGISAYHQRKKYKIWASDGTNTGDDPQTETTNDTWGYSVKPGYENQYYHPSINGNGNLLIEHDPMGIRVEVDTTIYVVWNVSDPNVKQELSYTVANIKTKDRNAYDEQYGYDIQARSSASVDVRGESKYIDCYELYYHYTDHYTYSSGEESGGVRSELRRAVNPSIITCNTLPASAISVGEKKITFPANKHNTDSVPYVISSTYGGYTDTVTFTQYSDYLISGTPVTSHEISVKDESDNVSATGGRAVWNVNATKVITTPRNWYSDGQSYSPLVNTTSEEWSYIKDDGSETRYTPSASGSVFTVEHTNMGANVATDYVKYKLYNVADPNKKGYAECSATNRVESRTRTSRSLSLSAPAALCTESYIYLTPNLRNDYLLIYTSEARGTDWDSEGSITIYVRGSSIGVTSSGSAISYYVGTNKYTTSQRSWGNVYASCDGTTSTSITIYQNGDTKDPAGNPETEHYLNVTDGTYGDSDFTAAGGKRTWNVNAYSVTTQNYEWRSDGTSAGSISGNPVTEGWDYTTLVSHVRCTPSASGSVFTVEHTNMGANEVTDSASYRIYNTSDSNKYADRSVSATNEKHVTPEYTTGFSIGAIQKVTSSGDTIPITGQRSYVTEYVEYDSGYHSGGTSESAGFTAQSVAITSKSPSGSWCRVSGGSIVIDANNYDTGTRTVYFTASYDGFSGTGSIEQWRCDYTDEAYRCTSFSIASPSVPASSYGQAAKVEVTFVAQKQVTRHHDGVSTVLSWEASDQPHRITCSNSDFTLYNATRGTVSDDITAYSGDSIYVYPTSANTSSSGRSTTLTEMVSRNTASFTQEGQGIVKPTCRISRTFNQGELSFTIIFSATHNVASDITVTYDYGYIDFRGRHVSVTGRTIVLESGINSKESLATIGEYVSSSITSISPVEDNTYIYEL